MESKLSIICCLKKNQTTPKPSEHPPVMGEKMSKRLGGIKRLQIQNLFMAFKNRFPDADNIGSTVVVVVVVIPYAVCVGTYLSIHC